MEFDDFLQAVTERPAQGEVSRDIFERVTVLGGGSDARLLAALCLSNGASVRLFSAYASELVINTQTIRPFSPPAALTAACKTHN